MTNAKTSDVKKQLQELEEKLEEKIRKEYKLEFQKELKKVRSEFDKKLTDIQNKLVSELAAKDRQLMDLNKELIEVKKGAEFISKKLDDSDAVYNENQKEEIKQTTNLLNTIGELKEKTRDLEDRGRRQNLVFFNIFYKHPSAVSRVYAKLKINVKPRLSFIEFLHFFLMRF